MGVLGCYAGVDQMPGFLDIFSREIDKKGGHLLEILSEGVTGPLDESLQELTRANWHELPETDGVEEQESFPGAIAVDGSMARRLVTGGSVFYIVRSLALCEQRRYRRLESDAVTSRADLKDIARYVNRRSDHIEHSVAREAVEAERSVRFLLLDGSLHGRLTAVPRDMPHEGQKGFMVEYFREYLGLMETCKKRDVVPVGVSKDSRVTLLRDYLLRIMLEEDIRGLGLGERDAARMRAALERALDKRSAPHKGKVQNLETRRVAKELGRITQILSEAMRFRSDHQMIMSFAKGEGYSTPIELSLHGRAKGLLEAYARAPREYVTRHFAESIEEAENRQSFIKHASEVLSRIPSLPTSVSFHVRLDRRDTPLRIDLPSWALGLNHSLGDISEPSVIDAQQAMETVSMLRLLFGGLRHYNVLLATVDSEVRLKRDVVDHMYIPLLEKDIGLSVPLSHARGYRRGWYVGW